MVTSETLFKSLCQELDNLRLPSVSLLYDSRITIDLACMLYARETIFSKRADSLAPWVVHLRADSSPQFGRDFLVVQADVVRLSTGTILDCNSASITKRLLPIQCVGSRAAGEHQKLEKLMHSMSLEAEDAPCLACSLLH